ncbi:MAG: DUF2141 domain-containing protein [Candidatus Firestonebacteria bacterium]|nr:DUF2141 domain-containing protein [Candidatus Firestonebacteria bacterium]
MRAWTMCMALILGITLAAQAETAGLSEGNSPAAVASLTIEISGLRNDHGEVKVALFQSRDGFPSHPEKAFRRATAKISTDKATCELPGVPGGDYVVSVIHDENQNDRVDTNFFGLPAEGVGVSNNAKGKFGPPAFEDARFHHGTENKILKIRMAYLL